MLHLPQDLPIISTLREEGAAVAPFCQRAFLQVPRPEGKTVLLLNLMPQKEVTELDIARMMAGREEDVHLLLVKISGQTYKTTPQEHMDRFYVNFEDLAAQTFDRLIVTGAPVEHLPFEEVRYWQQLCGIMDWAETHVRSTLYVCWGAQAGLYHHYSIPKYALPAKMFGIFPQRILDPASPLLRGLPDPFPMPNSRHTEVRATDFRDLPVRIIAQSEESGVGIASTPSCHQVFIVGHFEYAAETLQNEFLRDRSKGLPIAPPRHYYQDDDPHREVCFSWRDAARTFYGNWLGMNH